MTEKGRSYPRILGTFETARPGPMFIVSSGIHGNEPAGAEAALAVCARLMRDELPLRGRFLALAGNLQALGCGARYIDQDLNRLWRPESIAALRAQSRELDTSEQREQRELLAIWDDCLGDEHEAFVLDLHTSSADGAPFSCMADTIGNRQLAFALPLPVILGLEETIDGAMLDYVYERGHVAVAVEGGKHDAAETEAHLEAAIWISLVAAGSLDEDDVPDLSIHRRRLEKASRGIPRVLEIRHREVLVPEDSFEMMPGYESFDRIDKGELLAHKNGQELHAKENGHMLLPLYQGQGSDGYFLARRVRPFWLKLSAWLRRIRFSRVLSVLPGVRRHRTIRDAFVVNPKIAMIKPTEIFHLLGFRRERWEDGKLVFTRRPEKVLRKTDGR